MERSLWIFRCLSPASFERSLGKDNKTVPFHQHWKCSSTNTTTVWVFPNSLINIDVFIYLPRLSANRTNKVCSSYFNWLRKISVRIAPLNSWTIKSGLTALTVPFLVFLQLAAFIRKISPHFSHIRNDHEIVAHFSSLSLFPTFKWQLDNLLGRVLYPANFCAVFREAPNFFVAKFPKISIRDTGPSICSKFPIGILLLFSGFEWQLTIDGIGRS